MAQGAQLEYQTPPLMSSKTLPNATFFHLLFAQGRISMPAGQNSAETGPPEAAKRQTGGPYYYNVY
jgi:hypothetical protein